MTPVVDTQQSHLRVEMNSFPDLWAQFREAFCEALSQSGRERLWEIWHRESKRTEFYAHELLEAVAQRLGMSLQREFLAVDYVLKESLFEHQPLRRIFIESENNVFTATHEVEKLCCVSAPLKVLITVAEWEDKEPRWRSGHRSHLLLRWRAIRRANQLIWPDRGQFWGNRGRMGSRQRAPLPRL